MCEVQAESCFTKFKRSVAALQSELSLYTPLYYPDKYAISSPNSDVTNEEESENCPESPNLGEIKRMRKQCVPGASTNFRESPTNTPGKKFRDFYFRDKVMISDHPPYNFPHGNPMVTLSVYFNVKTTVRR